MNPFADQLRSWLTPPSACAQPVKPVKPPRQVDSAGFTGFTQGEPELNAHAGAPSTGGGLGLDAAVDRVMDALADVVDQPVKVERKGPAGRFLGEPDWTPIYPPSKSPCTPLALSTAPAPVAGVEMRVVSGKPTPASTERHAGRGKALGALLFDQWQRERAQHAEPAPASLDSAEHAAPPVVHPESPGHTEARPAA